jgi:hypothetical protein
MPQAVSGKSIPEETTARVLAWRISGVQTSWCRSIVVSRLDRRQEGGQRSEHVESPRHGKEYMDATLTVVYTINGDL